MASSDPLLVSPGENVWPASWFGNLSLTPLENLRPAPFSSAPGSLPGLDFTLPEDTKSSDGGLVTIHTALGGCQRRHQLFPIISFPVAAVHSIWVRWRQLEPSEGSYDFSFLQAAVDATAAAGWRVGLRVLTSRTEYAPTYLAGTAATTHGGINFDPADSHFHARYLELLAALESEGFCQHSAVAVAYVGYASKSHGDEYIGPHGDEALPGDPAVAYPHVRERLEAWARVCSGYTRKVVMGGESEYGASLGFGTRNGFVEHCASPELPAPTTTMEIIVENMPLPSSR